MRVRVQAFRLPKDGSSEEEYEDACWPEYVAGREARVFRCAVADGATEASFAGLWARLLVRAYCRGELSGDRLVSTLPALGAAWRAQVATRPLPWYAEEKLRSGAFAALAGLTLTTTRDGVCWRAFAIGDSCVFHLRQGTLLNAMPLSSAEDFNNRPHLLGTNPSLNGSLAGHLKRATGPAHPGDTFLLMTDALAAWSLTPPPPSPCGGEESLTTAHHGGADPVTPTLCGGEDSVAPAPDREGVDGRDRAAARQLRPTINIARSTPPLSPWQQLLALHHPSDFTTLIRTLRSTHSLRNDDVTLLRLDLR